jgi:arginyl-tRNA synthetase
VRFDNFYLESSLYADGRVEATVAKLIASGTTYEQEGALWLRTTQFGDDKDRVMRKSDGGYTYFVPDVAYHVTKHERGFATAINIQGSDHHGTSRACGQACRRSASASRRVSRLRAAQDGDRDARRRGDEDQQARRQLRDAARPDRRGRARRRPLLPRLAQGRFRVRVRHRPRALAVRGQSRVLRAVRARARRVGAEAGGTTREVATARLRGADLSPLDSPYEVALLRRLADFPGELAAAARDFAPHQVTFYLKDLAQEFHSYYNAERFLVDDARLRDARLALAVAVGQVLRNGLRVLGIGAPDEM